MDWKMMPQSYPLWTAWNDDGVGAYGLVIGWFGDWPDSLRPIVAYCGTIVRPESGADFYTFLTEAEAKEYAELLSR